MIKYILLISVVIFLQLGTYEVNGQRDSLFDWFFSGSNEQRQWYRRPLYQRRKNPKSYTRLTLSRKQFYYWDATYKPWSNWTVCDPIKCIKTRYRECKDKSWKGYVRDFKVEQKCPVNYIYERKTCNDTNSCRSDSNFTYNTNVNTSELPKECGIKRYGIQNKIIGGQDALPNSWPWHVALHVTYGSRAQYICGGTLLNSGWIITAAHCLFSIRSKKYLPLGKVIDTRAYNLYYKLKIVLGDHDKSRIDKGEVSTRTSKIIIHPKFQADYSANTYDVALIRLEQPVNRSKVIEFACLPTTDEFILKPGKRCKAIGWGNTVVRDPFSIWDYEFSWIIDNKRGRRRFVNSPKILQEVELPIVDFRICRKIYRIFNLDKKIHLCAGAKRKDTCSGDSGGGLFCEDVKTGRWYLSGITNFGSARGCGRTHGVYMRTAAISKWIKKSIQKIG